MDFKIEVNDPIHGFIGLTDLEMKIINSELFQRLRRICQLSGAHYVYPTAEHTRFGHSIGAMHLAGEMGKMILNRFSLEEDQIHAARVAALLHDIGHGPFSHVFEEVLLKKQSRNHEMVAEWLINRSELGDLLEEGGLSKKHIAELVRGIRKPKRNAILSSIVAGQVDADKMDYLVRDSFYCGVNYGLIDIHRLIHSIDFTKDYAIQFDLAARGALESFLVARYEMFLNVYYHKTVRSVEVMLVKLIDAADDVIELTDFTDFEEFAALDDFSLMSRIRMINPTESVQAKEATNMLELLESRILYKSAFEKVLHTEDQFVSRILTKQKVRESIQEEIATNAGVPANEVIVDVPTLPSIPYDIHQLDPMEIKIFEIIDRKKFTRNLSEYSSIADMMKVYLDVIRVYTSQKNRARVGRAAREVFKEIPDTALIHM